MIDYEEDWLIPLLCHIKGSVGPRAGMYAIPAAVLAVLLLYLDDWFPGMREDLGFSDIGGSQIWNAATGVIVVLCNFRTRQGLARFWEGTGLLHQMRGEWFDTVSNCVTFSISAKPKMPRKVKEFRHALVRLMSLCHGSALEEIADNTIRLDTIDAYGLDDGTLNHLRECHEVHQFNKVEVMLHLVQSLITQAHHESVLNIPPPILSRVYQTISRGFVNLLNAKKIVDTRFPFPYVQLISFLLLLHTALTPMIITAVVKSKVLAAAVSFIPMFGLYSLNFIAIELENPFGTDDNDLPMSHFQTEMNGCLLMLLHDNTDMIAGTSDRAVIDFYELLGTMRNAHDSDPNKRLSAWGQSDSEPFGKRNSNSVGKTASQKSQGNAPEEAAQQPSDPAPAAAPAAAASGATPVPPPEPSQAPQAPATTAPAALPPAPEPVTIEKGMEEFIQALDKWSSIAQTQVKQLDQSFHELKRLGDLLPQLFLTSGADRKSVV